ncbi:hypothetical protein [Micromonospora deserti]|uniref:Uncharacterized protein n=1 Tax=Micromonospora deserti TaxID=2070366 RepID=A0A2W2BSQ5_9ACTN|nr:hypothetical protein [Micromonospora deserti]PZF90271.1 hypothetical protein C1I99_24640 [Micromonospora deserti]
MASRIRHRASPGLASAVGRRTHPELLAGRLDPSPIVDRAAGHGGVPDDCRGVGDRAAGKVRTPAPLGVATAARAAGPGSA